MSILEFNHSVINLSTNLKPYALNLTQNIEDAKDLMQETSYRALMNKEKFREGTNLKAWLFTIMRNIFINNYRRKSKRKTILDQTDNQYYINSGTNVINNKAETHFVVEDIQNAITNLSDDYRIPFMMHYNGFKYQEIADDLQLPLGTVKSRIFFARKELKVKLWNYNPSQN